MRFTKRLYMDYASSTPVAPEVAGEMFRALRLFGNPSAPHEEGRHARALLDAARVRLARTLSVRPETLVCTGSGTESNNLAIAGVLQAFMERGARPEELHVVASAFEHPSVSEVLARFEAQGVSVSYVAPTHEGIITPKAVLAAIRPETVLVTVACVQSELGVIQPMKDISRALNGVRSARAQTPQSYVPEAPLPLLHSDASQGALFLDVCPERLGVDLATYDAQKVEGPKGVGLLYRSSTVPLAPLVLGGKQERSVRAGTENVAGVVGMARAFERALAGRRARSARVEKIRDYFLSLLATRVPSARVNGSIKERLPNNVHISIPGVDGDYLAVLLDHEGVAVSPRSACMASGSVSKAVVALGEDEAAARGTIRFTFAPNVSKYDARRAVSALVRSLTIIDRK